MKQHITPSQASSFTEDEFYHLFRSVHGLVRRKDWANFHHKKVTIGKLMEILSATYRIEVSNAQVTWSVKLFDSNSITCLYVAIKKELVDALVESVHWIAQQSGTEETPCS